MTDFKAYRHANCIIYTGKNRKFLEAVADTLKILSVREKHKLNGHTQNYGGIKYESMVIIPESHVVIMTVPQSKKNKSMIVLSEDYK